MGSPGLSDTKNEVIRLNEPDVDLYAWINNRGSCSGVAYVGTACHRSHKTSLTRGPSRGLVETAEVRTTGLYNNSHLYILQSRSSIIRANILFPYYTIYHHFIFFQTLVHEMGHNLGMSHDFATSPAYKGNCRKDSDSSQLPCNQCHNYQSGNSRQPIGPITGHPQDCCNGFMGYYNHPHFWSNCSVRYFRQHYVSRNWDQCMEAGKYV